MLRFVALWLLVHVGSRLPVRVLYAAAAVAGTIAWYGSRRVREVTRDHMRHALGVHAPRARIDAAARRCVRATADYYADFASYVRVPPERLSDHIDEIEGVEHLFHAYDRGQGVILASAHLGNPEVIGQAAGAFGIGFAVMTEPLEPPAVHNLVHRVRARSGTCFVPATPAGLRDAIRHLRNGGTLGLLIDRDVLGTGVPWPFFGERAPLPVGAVDLARRTGAAIVLGSALRTGPLRYRITLEPIELPPPIGDRARDLQSGMDVLIPALERLIRADPGQWFPLQPIWRGIPGASPAHRREPTPPRAVQSK